MENLIKLYALEIVDGKMKIKQVPKRLQADVSAEVKRLKEEMKSAE